MGALQAKENIWYVGVQDPGLRVFDIIMHSDHGTSYNSYIVKGTEKTVLFETSKEPFFEEFLANIREVCDPASLDYIVVNHTEPDHTGSMKRLLELAPGATVLGSGVQKYFDMYRSWCRPEQRPEKVVAVAYVSAYGYTRRLAEHIRDGLKEGGVRVEMYDLVSDDTAAAKAAGAAADGFLLGSPTLVGDALPPVYEMFLGLNPIIHKGKPAGAFGSYGWSGEAVPNLTARMQQLRLSLPLEGMRVRFCPTQEDLAAAVQFGRDFAKAVRGE